jgi:hypothetical protein
MIQFKRFGWASVVVTAVALVCGPGRAADLVKAGQPRAVIVLTEDAFAWKPPEPVKGRARVQEVPSPLADVRLAADELREHLAKMSGADLEVVAQGADLAGRVPIYLDAAADSKLEAMIRKQGSDPGAFALLVGRDRVDVRGLSPEGTLFGVYELLEQLGVRWFFPGDLGQVIPESKDVSVKAQETVQFPSFPARWASGSVGKQKQWQRRLRMGGPHFPSAHGVRLPKTHSFAEHPEYYSLIGGVRKDRQLCISNPDVLAGAIQTTREYFRANPDSPWIGMGPNDGGNYCECDACHALDAGDPDPFAAKISMTDRYIWFFNRILEGIADEFPDKKIGFYSYAAYNRPPIREKPNPRIIPAFAPITLCRIHGLGNPICPEHNVYYRWMVQEWGKILPEVYDRGYWFNLADPGLLFPMMHRIRTQIPISHELGITGWRVECLGHWGSETPSLYLAGKLMWNHQADADAVLQDFYTNFFGPAAGPMGRYFALADAAVRDGDFHTGSSWDIPNLYPFPMRQQARTLLDEAANLAGQGVYGDRIKIFREVLDYTEAFIAMMERRAAHHWPAARTALARMDALRGILLAYPTPMLNEEAATSYLKRFFRPCTEQGYERAVEKGTLLAGLQDEWFFKLDTEKIGETLAWFSPELTGGNWRRLRTSTLSWSDQDLRTYKGDAWYRQTVVLPAEAKDKPVFLWCGGVDELATVWVNGQSLGNSPGRALVPFEFDASAVVRPGADNVVVFRVRNEKLNEVGTGGIVAPVFFWTPKDKPHEATSDGEDVTPIEFK